MGGPERGRAAGALSLGSDMQARLRGVVRALLDAPGLEGAPYAVQLAVVVLASRTPWGSGVVEIRTSQVARWVGLSRSYTASVVVPWLRASGVVEVESDQGEFKEDVGLRCRVVPLLEARGVVGHPLNLRRSELAMMLFVMEALMAPGWTLKSGEVIPSGLLAARTGKGAPTDRLALLLLVLEAREDGRVRQCGGVVKGQRGRAAVTLARLLGCTAAAAERVLERLEEWGVVVRPRAGTGSGLGQRGRLVVPAVAAARGGQITAGRGTPGMMGAPSEGAVAGFSGPDVAATPSEESEAGEKPQVSEVPEADNPAIADPDDAATLHANHASGVPVVGEVEEVGGFSGVAGLGSSPFPERVCVGEEPELGEEAEGLCGSSGAGEGPLRGEQPNTFPIPSQHQQPATAGAGHTRTGSGKVPGPRLPRRRLVQVPELGDALRPVGWLWDRLSGWQQQQIETAARAELVRLAGLVPLPQDAPRALAERLEARIAQSRGLVMIRQPYPWLLHRALVQRPACSDTRCDDGISLDTGQACESCGNVIHLRRAHRARLGAELDQEQPDLPAAERRRVLEERLRAHTEREAEARERRHAAQRARSDRMRAAARERAAREQEEAAARERVRQALPCADCGREDAAGLCQGCGRIRELNALIVEAGMCQVSWTVNPRHTGEVAAVMDQVRDDVLAQVAVSVGELRAALDADGVNVADDPSFPDVASVRGLRAAREAAADYRATALAQLARTRHAQTEGRYAHAAEQSRSHHRHDPTGPQSLAAAARAAETARTRTAEHLLTQRLTHLREQHLPTPAASDEERLSEAFACVPGSAARDRPGADDLRA